MIVTGGAGGIGSAIAARLARAGARIMIADCDATRGVAVAQGLGPEHAFAKVDVADFESASEMVREAGRAMGGIDVLVHCAGIALLRSIFKITPAEWRHVIDVNLMGTYHCCLAAAKAMVEHRSGGSIITTASVAAERPARGATAYGASKGGVVTFTRALASELADHAIRVNAIAPGPVDTGMVRNEQKPAMRAGFERMTPMHRYARPTEVASAALYLASDESSFVTGSVVTVDGGYLAAGNLVSNDDT